MTTRVQSGQKIFKSCAAPVEKQSNNEYRFTLSTEAKDRYGDVIRQDGWDLSNFRQNPMALFSHNHNQPIGNWKSVRVVDKKLKGTLSFPPKGTSALADEVRGLIDADVLRAVSIGMIPKDWKYIEDANGRGIEFLEHELLECSVVSLPANPEALIDKAARRGLPTSAIERALRRRAPDLPGSTVLFELVNDDYDARPGGYGQIASDYHEGYDDGYAAGVASARKVAVPTRSFISPPTPRYEIDTDQVDSLVKGAVRRSLTDSVQSVFRKSQGKLD